MGVRHSWAELVAAVEAAADQTVDVLAEPAVARSWDQPSVLPEMSVGMIAAHLAQMLGALPAWLDDDPPDPLQATVLTDFDMCQFARVGADEGLGGSTPRTIREWSQSGAARGARAVAERARRDRDRLAERLDSVSADRLIPSAVKPGAATRLENYLATRCVELVVHLDDLTASVGIPTPSFDPTAVAIAVDVVVQMCRARVGDLDVLRAFTRADRTDPDTLRAL